MNADLVKSRLKSVDPAALDPLFDDVTKAYNTYISPDPPRWIRIKKLNLKSAIDIMVNYVYDRNTLPEIRATFIESVNNNSGLNLHLSSPYGDIVSLPVSETQLSPERLQILESTINPIAAPPLLGPEIQRGEVHGTEEDYRYSDEPLVFTVASPTYPSTISSEQAPATSRLNITQPSAVQTSVAPLLFSFNRPSTTSSMFTFDQPSPSTPLFGQFSSTTPTTPLFIPSSTYSSSTQPTFSPTFSIAQPSSAQPQPFQFQLQPQPRPAQSFQPPSIQSQPPSVQSQPSSFQFQPRPTQPPSFQFQPRPTQSQPLSFQFQPQSLSVQPQPSPFQPQPSPFQPQPSPFQPQPSPFQPQHSPFQFQPSPFQPQPSPFQPIQPTPHVQSQPIQPTPLVQPQPIQPTPLIQLQPIQPTQPQPVQPQPVQPQPVQPQPIQPIQFSSSKTIPIRTVPSSQIPSSAEPVQVSESSRTGEVRAPIKPVITRIFEEPSIGYDITNKLNQMSLEDIREFLVQLHSVNIVSDDWVYLLDQTGKDQMIQMLINLAADNPSAASAMEGILHIGYQDNMEMALNILSAHLTQEHRGFLVNWLGLDKYERNSLLNDRLDVTNIISSREIIIRVVDGLKTYVGLDWLAQIAELLDFRLGSYRPNPYSRRSEYLESHLPE